MPRGFVLRVLGRRELVLAAVTVPCRAGRPRASARGAGGWGLGVWLLVLGAGVAAAGVCWWRRSLRWREAVAAAAAAA